MIMEGTIEDKVNTLGGALLVMTGTLDRLEIRIETIDIKIDSLIHKIEYLQEKCKEIVDEETKDNSTDRR